MRAITAHVSRLLTASSLQRYAVCAAAAVLPVAFSIHEAAFRGSGLHRFVERIPQVGKDEALLDVPEEYRAAAEVIDLDALPLDAMRWAQEVTFAFDVATGKAREVGRGLTREQAYDGLARAEIGGTADVVGISADGQTVVILDYKFGRVELPPAPRNWQIRFLLMAAARTYGASNGRGGLIKLYENGTASYNDAEFDAFEVDVIAHETVRLYERAARAEALYNAGEVPPCTTSDLCRYCPSLPFCPAQTAMVRAVANETAEAEWERPVTVQDAARAWEKVKAMKAALSRVERNLYTYAAGNPIPLPNGLVLGQVESTREEVDGEIARRVLGELHGTEVAERACEWSTSKAAIERALRPLASPDKKITHLKREALAAIGAAGGITRNTTTSVREHVPDTRAAKEIVADVQALTAELKGDTSHV